MRRTWMYGWVVGWAFLLGSCAKEDDTVDDFNFMACDCGKNTLRTLVDATGEIKFNDGIGKYAIYQPVPNSIDSKTIFFICQLPERFQVEGLQVRFSGEAKEPCNTPTVGTGANEFFDLRVTELRQQ